MRSDHALAWAGQGGLVALALLAVAAAVLAPLAAYSVTLAAFGAAHVLSELRYVDRRFGRALGLRRVAAMGAFLAGAVLARSVGVFGWAEPAFAAGAELTCVTALVLCGAIGGSVPRRSFAVLLALALGGASLASPFDTLIALSLLHNFTPLAFLWEIAPRERRPAVMGAAIATFIGLPLVVASGLPRRLLAGLVPHELDPIGAGPLAEHIYVYVPRPLLAYDGAIDLFSAAVVAQCAHYAAVILVLPAILAIWQPGARGLAPWPRGLLFAALLVLASLAVFVPFLADFTGARALYGIAASVHAWIELPLIVIALTGAGQARRTSPTAAEAPLTSSETASEWRADSPAPQARIAASASTTAASPTSTAGT